MAIGRVTTNAMIRRYTTNLNNALGDLDAKRNIVATHRNFNTIAEDPSSAMKSFKLRSNFWRANVHQENVKDARAKFEEVTSNVLNCSSMAKQFIEVTLQGFSGPTSSYESRLSFQQEVINLQDSFLQQMNGKYNENFIFGGASTKDLPFTKAEDGTILYRGLPVDTPTSMTRDEVSQALSGTLGLSDNPATTPPLSTALNDIMGTDTSISFSKIKSAIENSASLSSSQKETLMKDNENVKNQLLYNAYFNEHSYRDIGFGMKEKNNEIVSTSAFDTAVNGLEIFGYGVDEEGLPNNIVALAGELADLLGKENLSAADIEKYDKITNKMKSSLNDMIDNGLAALGTKAAFLENTDDQLTKTTQTLNEQISALDFCDPAEAITNLMWSQYAYNATLKVGNSLLSNSFIDFMN